jgi:hypothetical protein
MRPVIMNVEVSEHDDVVERLNVDVPGANNVFWALSITLTYG